ncbi:hypothetical protein ACU4GD_01590 [Cupriavidus basilensis]
MYRGADRGHALPITASSTWCCRQLQGGEFDGARSAHGGDAAGGAWHHISTN